MPHLNNMSGGVVHSLFLFLVLLHYICELFDDMEIK